MQFVLDCFSDKQTLSQGFEEKKVGKAGQEEKVMKRSCNLR